MKTHILILFLLITMGLSARQLYLSPSGSDTNSGLTPGTAWQSPNTAFGKLVAGDTLWVQGGTYTISSTIKSANPATKSAPILVSAIRGEKPIFDCTSFRHYGSESSTYRGMDLRQPFWRVRGIKIYKAGYNGIIIAGENITVEGMVVQECGMDGIALAAGAVNAYILNCDSYRNCNVGANGENGDGFAAKEGTGTVFRGCRAWENADDGWDVYGGNQPILIDSCWSYGNGVNYWADMITSYQGDGNGFKLGGGGGIDGNAPNVVLHSFAFGNLGKGFDQNHNSWGITCIHCTGYNNGGLGNFGFDETPSMGKHVMINNISYGGTGQTIVAGSTETTNSWNLGLTFTDDMFESLNVDNYKVERDDDYRLTDPRIKSLFKLKSNNPAIDKGTVQTTIRLKPFYAIPYAGVKPDLGAKEYDSGNWTFPTPDQKDTTVTDTTQTNPGTRPTGTKSAIITQAAQFTVKTATTSSVWGPFCLASAESAVFDMQAVGSSSGAVTMEFSKDNKTWQQVGTQAKNGSTSWVTGKLIDLSADTAPWGATIYIRFNNASTKDVNIKNLIVTGTLYTPTALDKVFTEDSPIIRTQYFNSNGLEVSEFYPGFKIVKKTHADGTIENKKVYTFKKL